MKIVPEETLALVIDYKEKLIPAINNNKELIEKSSILINLIFSS